MSNIEPAVTALTKALSAFLGDPTGDLVKMRWWKLDDFEVAVQRDVGPHVWIASRWKPKGGVFTSIDIDRYSADKPRFSNLKGNCPTLWVGHEVRRLTNVGAKVQTVASCVRACAVEAGIVVSE